MTRPEKRYFKLYLARHSGNSATGNHAQLFDAVAAMEQYDERALRKAFSDAPFVKHFAIAKRRLYETILLSLDAFHAESSVDARLRRTLHQTEILHARGLYPEAERMLRSVRALAQEHEKHSILLQVVEWEHRLLERTNYGEATPETLGTLAGTAQEHLLQWELHEALWQLKSRTFLTLYRRGKARTEKDRSELEEIRRNPLLENGRIPASARSRYLYHHVRAALAYALGDAQASITELECNAELLRPGAGWAQEEPNLLFGVLSNLAYLHMRAGRHERALELLKEFRKLPLQLPQAPSPDLELKVFAMGTSLELTLWARAGRFDKAVEKLAAAEAGLEHYHDRLSTLRKAGIQFQAAWVLLGHGRAEEALRWSHRLLNEPGIEHHRELFALARLLNVLLLLELDRRDLLVYALRNTERHLKAHQRTFRCEEAILRFVHRRLKAEQAEEVHNLLAQLHGELVELAEDPLEGAVFDHFDPLVWVEGHLTGRTMSQAAQERAERRSLSCASDREAA
ncbi:MAG TPA: hypothetical protein VGE21_07410 [Flavobacteriales bacterium]